MTLPEIYEACREVMPERLSFEIESDGMECWYSEVVEIHPKGPQRLRDSLTQLINDDDARLIIEASLENDLLERGWTVEIYVSGDMSYTVTLSLVLDPDRS